MATVDWSDLPKEIWPIIGKFIHTRIDVLRFRSVCSVWRSSRPPFLRPPPPPLPLKFSPSAADPKLRALLFQNTTYRIEPIADHNRKCGACSKSKPPFLIKLEYNPNSGEMRLVHPVNSSPLRCYRNPKPKEFNLLDFQLVELRKSYVLKFGKNSNFNVKSVHRLVVVPSEFLEFSDVSGIFMIYNGGRLAFVRFGDDKLTRVDENAHYDDIIVYKGQCYVVDKWGTISWISSGLQVIQFSPPLCGFGGQKYLGQKYLVESCGDLYVVDQFFEKVTYHDNVNRVLPQNLDNELMFWHHRNRQDDADTIGFRVYKLDQEWGRWVDVKDLGDYIFILSNDGSFSVSSSEFGGVKGNCIFFSESVLSTSRTFYNRVFNLEDGRISSLVSLHSQMVHPPTSWLSPDLSLSACSEWNFFTGYELQPYDLHFPGDDG
ncbi:hypothetical protein ACLB2K_008523 [Fragaria x ananassa]